MSQTVRQIYSIQKTANTNYPTCDVSNKQFSVAKSFPHKSRTFA